MQRSVPVLSCAALGVAENGAAARRNHRPRGFWDKMDNKRAFLDGVAKEFNVRNAGDWKRVGTGVIVRRGGAGLLNKYPTFLAALQDVYPEEAFNARECRTAVPNGYWDCRARRRAFFDSVAAELNILSPADWKRVTTRKIDAMKGAGLLQKFQGSLKRALEDAYPGVDWMEHRPHKPAGHWQSRDNRKAFFDSLAKKLNIERLEDWGRVTREEVALHGGGALLTTQYPSLFHALADNYPAFSASAFRFMKQLPRDYWDCDQRVLDFVQFAEPLLNVSTPDDWYRVSYHQIAALSGGSGILTRRGRLEMLRVAYPSVDWREEGLMDGKKRSAQYGLVLALSELFTGC